MLNAQQKDGWRILKKSTKNVKKQLILHLALPGHAVGPQIKFLLLIPSKTRWESFDKQCNSWHLYDYTGISALPRRGSVLCDMRFREISVQNLKAKKTSLLSL